MSVRMGEFFTFKLKFVKYFQPYFNGQQHPDVPLNSSNQLIRFTSPAIQCT